MTAPLVLGWTADQIGLQRIEGGGLGIESQLAGFARRVRVAAAAAVAAIVGAFVMVSIYSDTRDASPETAGSAATWSRSTLAVSPIR